MKASTPSRPGPNLGLNLTALLPTWVHTVLTYYRNHTQSLSRPYIAVWRKVRTKVRTVRTYRTWRSL